MAKLFVAAVVALGVCLVGGYALAGPVIELTPDTFHGGLVEAIGGSYDDHGTNPTAAVDGNTGTPFYSKDSSDQDMFITIDLGAEYLIDHYEVMFYTPNTPGYCDVTVGDSTQMVPRAYDNVLQPRVVGTAGAVTDRAYDGVGGGWNTFVADNTAVVARYVDLHGFPAGEGKTGGWMEIRIFGSEPEAAVPEPATLLLVGTGALGVFGVIRRQRMK